MFHIRLKELREKKGLTQKQLSAFFKISRSSLASYETGLREPDFNMLMNIAQYFNVSIDYLLGYNMNQDVKKIDDTKSCDKLIDDIDSLTDKSKEELQRYIQLLKLSDIYENEEGKNLISNRKNTAK